MKFNLQLKKALVRYEKIVAPKEVSRTTPVRHSNKERSLEKVRDRPIEKVVGGDILWKPIDRLASMLISKAPWWALPPPVTSPSVQPQIKPKPRKAIRMSINAKSHKGNPHPAINSSYDAVHYEEKPDEVLNTEISQTFVKRTEQTLDKTGDLLAKALDARAAMDSMCQSWKETWIDFQEKSDARLQELRMTRIAMDTEMRQLMASLREVRQFFLDKDYETEVVRLKDFVETCERLQKLKQSGFLDTVADTMLKLSGVN